MAKGTKGGKTRNVFQELSSGVEAMRDDRSRRVELRRQRIEPVRTYQLKVTLMETDPPIWRRLRISGDTTLARLDRIIQAAMGWTNSHLHTFTARGLVYADPNPEWETDVRNERRARLDGIAREEGEAFVYESTWATHGGTRWSWRRSWSKQRVPCGHRALPVSVRVHPKTAAASMVTTRSWDAFATLTDEEHEETKTWMEGMAGRPFDPDGFDLEAVNRALEALR